MSMIKNSSISYSSMKRILFVLGLLALLVSTEFVAVHGRALRSTTTDNVVNPGYEEQRTADNEAVGVSSFAVSEKNSSSRNSFRSLAVRLASGPSKKVDFKPIAFKSLPTELKDGQEIKNS